MKRTPARRVAWGRRGVSAAEVVIWLPLVAVLAIGAIEFSWFTSQILDVSRAARDGSRHGAAVYVSPDETHRGAAVHEAEAVAHAVLEDAGLECGPGCAIEGRVLTAPSERVQVDVTYPYQPVFGVLPARSSVHYRFVAVVEVR